MVIENGIKINKTALNESNISNPTFHCGVHRHENVPRFGDIFDQNCDKSTP